MGDLLFLKEIPSPVEAFKAAIIDAPVNFQLSQPQKEKIKITTDFLLKNDQSKRADILAELNCPSIPEIVDFIAKYEEILKNKDVDHNLVDFDWSASKCMVK